jgi:glutaredoxin
LTRHRVSGQDQRVTTTHAPLVVYWQPGCTSCLAAKQFLDGHAVTYESVNVLESSSAAERLRALGVRTVPVVARGRDFVLAQDLDELARFVGVPIERERLGIHALVERIEALLEVAGALVAALPAGRLRDEIPGRPRRYADLGFHVAMIVRGFVAAARGGSLDYAWYEALPPEEDIDPDRLAERIGEARGVLAAWWTSSRAVQPDQVETYYGRRSLHSVLERTAWHVAQHVRQLDDIARTVGASRMLRLDRDLLIGLPLPPGVWDREIGAPP